MEKKKRFYLKFQFGQWAVMATTNSKMVVAYSQKADAEKTVNGLNGIRTENGIIKRLTSLKTIKGYGYYPKK